MIKDYFKGHIVGEPEDGFAVHYEMCMEWRSFAFNQHQPVVVFLFTNDKGEYLLQDHYKYGPTFPTGKMDEGEVVGDTTHREVREELGVTVEDVEYKFMFNHTTPVGETFPVYVVEITDYSGEIENCEPEKHLELMWVKPTELKGIETASLYVDMVTDFLKLDSK